MNRNTMVGVIAVIIILVLIGMYAGWFGGSTAPQATAPATTEQPAATTEQPAQGGTAGSGTTTEQPAQGGTGTTTGQSGTQQ